MSEIASYVCEDSRIVPVSLNLEQTDLPYQFKLHKDNVTVISCNISWHASGCVGSACWFE